MGNDQPTSAIEPYLRIALIQTQVPRDTWSRFPGRNAIIEWRIWQELRLALRGVEDQAGESPPKIILIPELSVPEACVRELKRMVGSLKAIVMCGVDYKRDFKTRPRQAENRACIIVPYDWPTCARVGSPREVYVGKNYPNLLEDAMLAREKWKFKENGDVFLFTSRAYGAIGVCVCYDFLDVERHLMYRGRVQHLIVLSYNRDFESFYHNAEALARTLYCNVVVCNTGTYGGSLAVTPYYEPFKRTIYRHQGSQLATVQIVTLPVNELIKAQSGQFDAERKTELLRRRTGKEAETAPTWKSRPPNYDFLNKEVVSAPPEQLEFTFDG